jgi:hypothetical protein
MVFSDDWLIALLALAVPFFPIYIFRIRNFR